MIIQARIEEARGQDVFPSKTTRLAYAPWLQVEGGNAMFSERFFARDTMLSAPLIGSPVSDFLSHKHKDYLAVVAELIRQVRAR